MPLHLKPIGYAHTDTSDSDIPRHWSVSDIAGTLDIMPKYQKGLVDIQAGQQIVVLFHFDRSPDFSDQLLMQTPPHKQHAKGVFSICSPRRPNPIGLSVLDVLDVEGCRIRVRGVDMYDGTPILDIKPHVLDSDRSSVKDGR